MVRALRDYYQSQLEELDYIFPSDRNYIPIYHHRKNLEMYSLIFASKDLRGYDFWCKISRIDHKGQQKLL